MPSFRRRRKGRLARAPKGGGAGRVPRLQAVHHASPVVQRVFLARGHEHDELLVARVTEGTDTLAQLGHGS